MPEPLLLVLVFGAGVALGASITWTALRPAKPAGVTIAPAPALAKPNGSEPETLAESELTTASKQLLSELETRYQGRTAVGDAEAPKRRKATARGTRRKA